MANVVINIAKGRIVEYYNRVKGNDPANSALIVVPIETSGLEADAVLIDKADLAAFLVGATNEQTTMGRKTLTDVELASFPGPDTANDRYDVSLPDITWAAATGNAISKLLVCYDNDTTGGTDSNIIPLCMFDFAVTPGGSDIKASTGVFFRAS